LPLIQHPCDRESHSRSALVIVKGTKTVTAGVQGLCWHCRGVFLVKR